LRFWNGSYLLDGVLDRNGYSLQSVTVTLRLTPPNGASPVVIELQGDRTNLPALADKMVKRVVSDLKLRPTVSSWNSHDEAQQYFDQANWAYRWKMFSQAAAQCEAAWALGNQTKQVAELRVRAYVDDGFDEARGEVDLTRRLVSFAPMIHAVPGSIPQLQRPEMGSGVPPQASRFKRIRRAMELFCQDFRAFIANDPAPGRTWNDIGLCTLDVGSSWLRHYYYTPEARAGSEDDLIAVQALCREMAELLDRHPSFTNDFTRDESLGTRHSSFPGAYGPGWNTDRSLPILKVVQGGYWFSTPEEGLAVFRDLAMRGQLARLRQFFLDPDVLERSFIPQPFVQNSYATGGSVGWNEPLSYLSGWAWKDRARVQSAWHHFLDELSTSPDVQVKTDGMYLRAAHAVTDAEYDRALRALLVFVEANSQQLLRSPVNGKLLEDIDALLQPKMRVGFDTNAPAARQALWKQVRANLADARTRGIETQSLDPQLKYLAAGEYDFQAFVHLFFQGNSYSEREATTLMPAVQSYRTNLSARLKTLDDQFARARTNQTLTLVASKLGLQRSQLYGGISQARGLESLLNSCVHPASPSAANAMPVSLPNMGVTITNATAPRSFRSTQAPSGPMPRGLMSGLTAGGTDPTDLPLTNALEVTRFWRLPRRLPGVEDDVALMIVSCCFRDGNLWLDTRYDRIGTYVGRETFANRGAIIKVNLDTFESEVIPLDPKSFSLPDRWSKPNPPRPFELFKGWLYVSSADSLKRYSLKDRTWEDLPIPVHGHARFRVAGDSLLLSTDDSILELAGNGREARILASSRRRPAVTALDSVDRYDGAPLVQGPEGHFVAWVGEKWYQQSPDNKDWLLLGSWPVPPSASCELFDDGLILTGSHSGPGERQMFALFNGAREPELLLSQPATMSMSPAPWQISPQPARPAQPRWSLPEGVRVLNYPVCLQGQALWVFAGRILPDDFRRTPPNAQSQTDSRVVLFRLEPNQPKPFEMAIRLRSPGPGLVRGFELRERVTFELTPRGLVVATSFLPGFWLIPQTELDSRLKAWREMQRNVSTSQAEDQR
jgi:hypothetical protein